MISEATVQTAKKSWTVRVNAAALAVLAWLQFDPVSVLYVWNMLPHSIRPYFPQNLVITISIVLFALSMFARLRPKKRA